MVRIKRIGVLSLAKIFGLLYAGLGLIFGAIFTFISVIGSVAGLFSSQSAGEAFGNFAGVLFGLGSIIFLPLIYGTMGFIFGLILAALYNLIAGWVGGIEVETQ